jgi:hypothetical protein
LIAFSICDEILIPTTLVFSGIYIFLNPVNLLNYFKVLSNPLGENWGASCCSADYRKWCSFSYSITRIDAVLIDSLTADNKNSFIFKSDLAEDRYQSLFILYCIVLCICYVDSRFRGCVDPLIFALLVTHAIKVNNHVC